ncbi:hypothetical protein Tco_0598940 [Tanacetum coccineum]
MVFFVLQDLVFEALDKRHMGEDRIISAKESVYRLVSLDPVSRSAPSKFQTKHDDLDDLHWTQEEDGEFETADPQFLLGSKMLEGLYPKMLGFLRRHYGIGSDSSHRALCSIDSESPLIVSSCSPAGPAKLTNLKDKDMALFVILLI